jgi:hypothetical protein
MMAEGFMQKIVRYLSILVSILVGAMFLSGAGVSYEGWYAMPENASKMVVTIATLTTFVKLTIFLCSRFFSASGSCKKT